MTDKAHELTQKWASVVGDGAAMTKRIVVPMNTKHLPLPRGKKAVISQDTREAWRADRLFVSAAGTHRGAADWLICSIQIDGREKLEAPVSGREYSTTSDKLLLFNVRRNGRVSIAVKYIGRRKGCPFYAAFVGPLR